MKQACYHLCDINNKFKTFQLSVKTFSVLLNGQASTTFLVINIVKPLFIDENLLEKMRENGTSSDNP